jgi:hypothetical protein
MNNSPNCCLIRYEILRELDYTAFTGGFVPVGDAFLHPARMIVFNNDTDASMYISFNGVDRHLSIQSFTQFVFDYGSNMATQAGVAELPAYDRVWVQEKGAVPTSGSLDVAVTYLSNV